MPQDQLHQIARRTERYWFEDGIWEIGFGLIFALLALFYWITSLSDWTGPRSFILLILQMGVFIGALFIMGRVVKTLKERITYPRTGYVAYRRPEPRTRLRKALVAGLVAALIGAFVSVISSLQVMENRLPLITGAILAVALAIIGYRFNLLRMYLLALLCIVLGYGLSLANLAEPLITPVFFGSYGLLIFLSGLLTLLIYITRTRPAGEEEYTDYEAPSAEDRDA